MTVVITIVPPIGAVAAIQIVNIFSANEFGNIFQRIADAQRGHKIKKLLYGNMASTAVEAERRRRLIILLSRMDGATC